MRRTILIGVLVLAVVSLVLLAAQCAGGAAPIPTQPGATQPATPSGSNPYPAATGEPTPPTATAEKGAYPPPALNGEALLNDRCAGCHDLGRVKSAKKNPAEWQQTVDRMIAKGAQLTAEEAAVLVNYLAATYK